MKLFQSNEKKKQKCIMNGHEVEMDISNLNAKGRWIYRWIFESPFKHVIDPEVIRFIAELRFHGGDDKSNERAIHNLFTAGYCYHFAVILKNVFNRGKICLHKDHSHIVWVDDINNMNIPYDIDGMYYDLDELIPIEELSEEQLEPYIHRSDKYYLDNNL